MKTTIKGASRFDSDPSRYAAYVDSPEGRLRAELASANLQEFLPTPDGSRTVRALDIGGGTGVASVPLARLGIDVTLLDSSLAMLELAEQNIMAAGVQDRLTLKHTDATQLSDSFPPQSFDIVICHNLLEYVDNPGAVLRDAARLLRNSSAVLSVLVRNQAGEVLKAALKTGDLAAAEQNLAAEWAQESLYGGNVRLFTPEVLAAIMDNALLTIAARRGVRVIVDYLGAKISLVEDYDRIFALERMLGTRLEFFGIARYLHILARSERRREVVG